MTVIRVTDGYNASLVSFSLGIAVATFTFIALQRLTQAVRRMMERRGFKTIIVYLDDFLIIGETKEECQQVFTTLLQLLLDLGFQISWRKVIGPTEACVLGSRIRYCPLRDGTSPHQTDRAASCDF